MRYIFVDPSGNFNEGKGHTGIAYCNQDLTNLVMKSLTAKDYKTRHDYWLAIIATIQSLIEDKEEDVVVIESFMIRTQGFLLGKMPETIQFIGALCWELENMSVKYILQTPAEAKSRFKDEDLPRYIPELEQRGNRYYYKGKQTNDHMRDALKHLLYFYKYKRFKL